MSKVYLSKALLPVPSLSARLAKVPLVLRPVGTRPHPSPSYAQMESTTKVRHFPGALDKEILSLTLAL
jgi:hypothetical protein